MTRPTYDHTDCDVGIMRRMKPKRIDTALPGVFFPIVLTRKCKHGVTADPGFVCLQCYIERESTPKDVA